MKPIRDFLLSATWLIGLPLALLINITFPIWFPLLCIYCGFMAGRAWQ